MVLGPGLRRGLLAPVLALAVLACDASAAERLSDSDALWTRNAFKAGIMSRWQTAESFASRVSHPLAAKLLRWRMLTAAPKGVTFDDLDRFLSENPDWPSRNRLLRQAERLMPFDFGRDETLIWFAERGPVSAAGAMRLGAAKIAAGDEQAGREMVRRAWIDGNFTSADEKDLYKRFRRYLTRDDHVRRMDRLLWDGKTGAARRMLYRVPADWQKLAQARFSLRQRRGNVDFLVSKVPTQLQDDLGLVYERLRWRRRKGLDSAYELLKNLPADLPRPELWWREKSILARKALAKGHVSEAYEMAKTHGIDSGGAAFADAEWLAGWVALRFLRDFDVAASHFEAMHAAVNYPISIARAAYWAGRAFEAKGADEAAVEWYRKAAENPLTYYGQLAHARLRPGKALELSRPDDIHPDAKETEAFENHELVRAVRILRDVGVTDAVKPFILKLFEISEAPAWWAMTAKLAREAGRPDLGILVAKRSNRAGEAMPVIGYPVLDPPALPKRAEAPAPEVPLTLAVIRQESAFRIDAKSHANARGLMQIIPPTAKRVSKALKIRFSRVKLMTDPTYNLTLGQTYLGGLIKDFDGSLVLALAAYNAGPHRAKRWIKANGDPRDDEVDAIDWVEMIPFTETRNYVQRVLENLQVYRVRLAETEVALGLADDLHITEN